MTETWILNGRTPGDIPGHYTCEANGGKSVVDYFLAPPSFFQSSVQSLLVHPRSDLQKHMSDRCALEFKLKLHTTPELNHSQLGNDLPPVQVAIKHRYDEKRKEQFQNNIKQPHVTDILETACQETCDASLSVHLLRTAIMQTIEQTFQKIRTGSYRENKNW